MDESAHNIIETNPMEPQAHTDGQSFAGAMADPQTASTLEWKASEYVEHAKSQLWFVGLAGVALVLLLAAIFLLHDYTFAVLTVVMAIAVAVWARRPASELTYQLGQNGLAINGKFFEFSRFRAFGLAQDGGLFTITLLSTKRFSPPVSIYFPPELGEQIVDRVGARLPMEDIEPDFIDKLTNRLHF